MAAVRGKDTGPEWVLRRALHAAGVRYRLHDHRVAGTPDLTLPKSRVAVFIDGCFWHGCPTHYRRPKSRLAFWDGKLDSNRKRRAKVKFDLTTDDWKVVEIWECQVEDDLAGCVSRIRGLAEPGR